MRHFPHYVTLFGILGSALIGFLLFSWDRTFQISLVVATMAAYAAWGIVHHWLHDDLYFEVVIEYAGIATLGGILAMSLLLS